MAKPKYLYEIDEKTVAHADRADCLTIQQGDLLDGDSPDKCIFLDNESLVKLRDAINEFLSVSV